MSNRANIESNKTDIASNTSKIKIIDTIIKCRNKYT